MNKKTNQYFSYESSYIQMIKNNITPLDLFIISKINDGLSIDDIAKLSEKNFDLKDSKKIVEKRIQKLLSEDKPELRVLLNSKPQYIVNPTKLYDIICLIFIKANLDNVGNKHLDIGVQNIFETIININNKPRFGKPIKQLFSISSMNYDFVGFICENNIERFNSFRNYLIDEGIVKNVDIVPINIDGGFHYDTIISPDFNNYKFSLIKHRKRVNMMLNEIRKEDVDSSKTIRFFDYDYEIHVLSGKNKDEIYPIDVNEIKIGRYHDNDIIIQDITISRRHAKITKIGNKYIFKDQSTNGSFVNDKHIIYNEVELKNGDIIRLGKNILKFQKTG